MFQDDNTMECRPAEVAENVNSNTESIIPEKSRKLYEVSYIKFLKWANENKFYIFNEDVLMSYFTEISKKYKSSTLWAHYSMLKPQLKTNHNVKMAGYTKLNAFLKQQSEDYTPKKSKILFKQEFDEFLQNAPDDIYLATKVVLIFGVIGACRCEELTQIKDSHIQDLGNVVLVDIRDANDKKKRSFTIINDLHIYLYRKYNRLRPKDANIERFFAKYLNGRCHRMVMGIHKIINVPKDVATFLKLPNPHEYTGHCLRRSSSAILEQNEETRNTTTSTFAEAQDDWKSTIVDNKEFLINQEPRVTGTFEETNIPSTSRGFGNFVIKEEDNSFTDDLSFEFHGNTDYYNIIDIKKEEL